jgi:hypothetical protein
MESSRFNLRVDFAYAGLEIVAHKCKEERVKAICARRLLVEVEGRDELR